MRAVINKMSLKFESHSVNEAFARQPPRLEYNHTDKKNNGKYRKQNRELAAACMQRVCTDIRWNIG